MNNNSQYSDEIKKITYEKTANIKYQLLQYINEIISLACSRGAFKGEEMSYIGAIYDSIKNGIEKGFEQTRLDIENSNKGKSVKEIIKEE